MLNRPRKKNHGLANYLDVSGSVNDSLSEILGILRKLHNEVTGVYQFSDKVVKTSMQKLTAGKIATTCGTSFDALARSIPESEHQKAVVITDGFSNIESGLHKQMKGKAVTILTILFGGGSERNDFAQFGEVIHLKDAVGQETADVWRRRVWGDWSLQQRGKSEVTEALSSAAASSRVAQRATSVTSRAGAIPPEPRWP